MTDSDEYPSIYIWPAGHEDGEPFPDDFWRRVGAALGGAGIGWEAQ